MSHYYKLHFPSRNCFRVSSRNFIFFFGGGGGGGELRDHGGRVDYNYWRYLGGGGELGQLGGGEVELFGGERPLHLAPPPPPPAPR